MKKLLLNLGMLLIGMLVNAQHWETNFDTAKARAANENKNIILVFSGSDWCAPCIKLDKNIWESNEFIEYSNKHYVLLRADFPRKRSNKLSKEQQEHNAVLAEKYNKRGFFPLVAVLNKKGKVLGTTGYRKFTPGEYIKHLNSFEK